MKTIPTLNQVILPVSLCLSLWAGSAWAGFEGYSNTFYGSNAGSSTTGSSATFVGAFAGWYNTTGTYNTFLGEYAGVSNTTGYLNTFLGVQAGYSNTTGYDNTFLGDYAGRTHGTGYNNIFLGNYAGYNNTTGIGNVFLGYAAGYYETGSNRLHIANSITTTPLIYGEFNTPRLKINGNLEVVGPNSGLVRLTDVTTNSTTKAARLVLNHYNNASLPVYLLGAASTPTQNFLAFGGGNAIGNAATQLDFFTAANTTTAIGTPRMTITGSGNVGMGVATPVYPLQMASGALVTAGGVWTNASSREYKENIKDLGTKEAALTLASLTPVTYNYKVDKTQAHVGFIAEDVPDLVATKDRKGLSPMDIVAVLTKVAQEQQKNMQAQHRVNQAQQRGMQEQQQTIATLTEKVSALEKEARLRASIAMTKLEVK